MRFAAVVAYDGTLYQGFQRQANAPSVQETIEDVLGGISKSPVRVVAAGRTDAGVHANGQVIAFDLTWKHSLRKLRSALNVNLPHDISVRSICEVEEHFQPRFDALSRIYVYRLYVGQVRDPLVDRTAWHIENPLDLDLAQNAANMLIGEHDFAGFGTPPQGENSVRAVLRANWSPSANGQYRFLIEANAFLYKMVRRIVAGLVKVGHEVMTVAEFHDILVARDLRLAPPPAPARGLSLTRVVYKPDVDALLWAETE
jgi:tRNA pseudouridine38-40 synthase